MKLYRKLALRRSLRAGSAIFLVAWAAIIALSPNDSAIDDAELVNVAKLCKSCAAYTVPTSIDARGNIDATAQLNAFIASVPDGSTISFSADSRYRIDGTLTVFNRRNLVIKGNGANFYVPTTGDRERSHWKFVGGSRIVLRDIVLKGANPDAGTGDEAYREELEAQHGVLIKGVDGFVLNNATITDVYGDFVYIGDNGSTWANNVTIRNSHFERNGRQGIAITAGRNILIANNYIAEVRRSTFDLEPNSVEGGAVNVTITANEIGAGRLKVFASGGAGGRIDNIVFSNNTINRPISIWMVAPEGSRRSNFRIVGNTSTVVTNFAPITITRVDGLVVTGNTQVFAGKQVEDHPVVSLNASCETVGQNHFQGKTWIVESDGYNCG